MEEHVEEHLEEGWLSTLDVIERIGQALKKRKPLSVVRVGDGENLCLAQYKVWPIRKVLATRWGKLSRTTNWKGVRLPNKKLRDELAISIQKADIVGIPYREDKEILAEKQKHLRTLTEACFQKFKIKPKAVCHTFVNRHMVEYQEFWEMLEGKKVAVISRWGDAFKKYVNKKYNDFNIHFVKSIRIDSYRQIPQVIRKMRDVECDIVFISAGVNAVILAQRLAEEQGRIAVDFGKSAVFMVKGVRSKVKPWKPRHRIRLAQDERSAAVSSAEKELQVLGTETTEGGERKAVKVTVIGSGYVGTTTALVLAKLGHQVIGYDVDQTKVDRLTAGILPFREPGLDDLLSEQLRDGRIRFTTDAASAIGDSNLLMIAVGTPSTKEGQADLRYLKQVLDTIAAHINGPKIVITKSTVPIGTNRWMQEELAAKIDFTKYPVQVVSNPEFLREGSALEDSLHPSRTVIGCDHAAAAEEVKQLYAGLPTSYFLCNYETAEMIKYASNGFLAAKISYINEMARLADKIGANIEEVAAGMGMDPRISPHHLRAGLGYGGSCFPKDVDELLYLARKRNVKLRLLEDAKLVNDSQIHWFAEKIESVVELEGKRVLVLGVSFKEDTDDQRESPGVKVIEMLLEKEAAEVRVFDPTVHAAEQIRWSQTPKLKHMLKVKVLGEQELADAAAGVHAVILTTPWRDFANAPWADWARQAAEANVFDGRNFLDPHTMKRLGWRYTGVSRGGER